MQPIEIPFLWIGEHPCLDLVNTQMMIEGRLTDTLRDFADVARWAKEADLISEEEAAGLRGNGEEAALAQVRELRAELRAMAEGLADGRAVSRATLAHLNALLARRSGHLELQAQGEGFETKFAAPFSTPRDLVARLAQVGAEFLVEADVSRVKRCGNPACVLLFLDTTKSRTRRWCSMGLCGNRHKAAAHYARHKNGG